MWHWHGIISSERKCGSSIKLNGIDPSEDMIRIAKRKNGSRNSGIQFDVGIGEKLEFEDNRFDLVVSSLTFHHLPIDVKRKNSARNSPSAQTFRTNIRIRLGKTKELARTNDKRHGKETCVYGRKFARIGGEDTTRSRI